MFINFFFYMRKRGLKVSLNEWIALLDALEKNLHHNNLTGFYHLCKAILIKSEADFDAFDQAFLQFFHDVPYQGELPDELMNWLNHPSRYLEQDIAKLKELEFQEEDIKELLKQLEERLKEQTEEHNGGDKWIGTRGTSPFGNNGWHPNGLRIGGKSKHKTAMQVIGERKYKDFRKDNTLDMRQFQIAFRSLRQLTTHAQTDKISLDLDKTIRATGDNAGILKLQLKPCRKNNIKLLLLMDSGGSMSYYSSLCSTLFQAATKSHHFKELHTYYFHNCIYDSVYTTPELLQADQIKTEWLFQNYDDSYKIIIVGDASMNPYELNNKQYNWYKNTLSDAGIEWLMKFKKKYPYLIWLNPQPFPQHHNFWTQTYLQLAQLFPMFQLSADGLEKGIKHLMARR